MSKIIVQGIKVDVTEAIETHTKEQFSKVLEYFEDHIVGNVEVKISVSKHHAHQKTASVMIPVVKKPIVIEEDGDNMYTLISTLADKSERQLRKLKDKKQTRTGLDKRLLEE